MRVESAGMTVPVQANPRDEPDLFRQIRDNVSSIVDILDSRFLYLMNEEARGTIPPEEVAAELSLLARDLKRCFRRLVEVEERRDLSFRVARELREVNQHCVWLFRKLGVQQAFLKKLGFEAKLRALISADAFNIYQTLLTLDDEERQS